MQRCHQALAAQRLWSAALLWRGAGRSVLLLRLSEGGAGSRLFPSFRNSKVRACLPGQPPVRPRNPGTPDLHIPQRKASSSSSSSPCAKTLALQPGDRPCVLRPRTAARWAGLGAASRWAGLHWPQLNGSVERNWFLLAHPPARPALSDSGNLAVQAVRCGAGCPWTLWGPSPLSGTAAAVFTRYMRSGQIFFNVLCSKPSPYSV